MNLLIVHGGGGRPSDWDGVARLLTDDFRVVRIHRRIYEPDADIVLPHSMDVEAADIVAVARLLDAPVLLVGHSSGAVASLEAALLDPSAFAGLALYEPPVAAKRPVGGSALVRARALLDAGEPVEAMRLHLRDIVQMPGPEVDAMFATSRVRDMFAARAAASSADTEAIDALGVGVERYAVLDQPTTLIQGDESPSLLRERLADLAAVLPDARVATLAGQGHVANVTAPDLLAEAVREAAARIRPSRL
ncbi:alpha/beta fold hydrolase [Actinomadura logoneensis]|nr:alpha/beta hydrolase [Actinomadura logoneensis]